MDDEDWENEDFDDEDDGYIPCPHCGATMLEAADYCPGCDRWITAEDAPAAPRSWWMIAIILTLIAVTLLSVVPF